jgi:hypothetical protein
MLTARAEPLARAAAATLLLTVACQSASSGGSQLASSATPAASPRTEAAVRAAASVAGPAATEAGAAPAGASARSATGGVLIVQARVPWPRSEADAYFSDTTYSDPTQMDPCANQNPRIGECNVCVASSHSDGRGSRTTRPLAGPITVSVGSRSFRLQPASGYYGGGQAPSLEGGETVRIVSAGDPKGVPAFSGEVVAPVFVALTATSGLRDRARLVAGSPVDVAWAPPSPDGQVRVELTAVHPPGPSGEIAQTHLVCEFDGKSGKGSIPADLLGQLATDHAVLLVDAKSTVVVHAGAFDVELGVSDSIVSGTVEIDAR